eukprot:1159787-Pelagomonas_calceolata.AAC.4
MEAVNCGFCWNINMFRSSFLIINLKPEQQLAELQSRLLWRLSVGALQHHPEAGAESGRA